MDKDVSKAESKGSKLTVVMPAYNEERSIEAAVLEVCENVLDVVPGAGLIVVNDGSRDSTGAILARMEAIDSRIKIISQVNTGHGPALRKGLEQASGEYLFLIDADRQIPLETFSKIWRLALDVDGVLGVRLARQDPNYRIILSRAIRWLVCLLFGCSLRDGNAPFKVIRRSLWVQARNIIPEDTLAPSLFIALYCKANRLPVLEVDVSHRARETGTSSLRKWQFIRFCVLAFWQLVQFRWRLARA